MERQGSLPGADPASPTLLWDWSRVKTIGTFTGPAVGILVLDIDEAKRFRPGWRKDIGQYSRIGGNPLSVV